MFHSFESVAGLPLWGMTFVNLFVSGFRVAFRDLQESSAERGSSHLLVPFFFFLNASLIIFPRSSYPQCAMVYVGTTMDVNYVLMTSWSLCA